MSIFKKVISNKKFKISVLVLSAIYIGMVLFMYLNQQNLLYHPEREKYGLAHYKITNAEEITLTSDDGTKLQAWYYRKPDHDCDMTVFLHGNAGSLDDRADKLKELADMGYGFIIPAWRGFGESRRVSIYGRNIQ